MGTWFGAVVVRTARKALRRRRLRARLGLGDPAPLDLEKMIATTAPPDVLLELRSIYQAMEALPVKLREVLVLRRIERRPLDEVAALVGASPATVKRWIDRAESALAEAGGKGRA